MNNRSLELAEKIVIALKEEYIMCYIWHTSFKTGSTYIRFENSNIGSIRIADHPGRKRLKYRYNIINFPAPNKRESYQYFIQFEHWRDIIPKIKAKNEYVKGWKAKKYYTIPNKRFYDKSLQTEFSGLSPIFKNYYDYNPETLDDLRTVIFHSVITLMPDENKFTVYIEDLRCRLEVISIGHSFILLNIVNISYGEIIK